MFRVHSKLSGKILKSFLLTYTVIFGVLSGVILAGAGIVFLYNIGKTMSSKVELITDVWDDFEMTRQEQVYALLSSDNLEQCLRAWYSEPLTQNQERVNLCLANFQTSLQESNICCWKMMKEMSFTP